MERDVVIVAGFGFRGAVQPTALDAVFALAQDGHPRVAALAAPADKVPVLAPLAARLGVPVIGVAPEDLAAMPTRTRSAASLAARGAGSVAEAAALAAAGPGARLLCTRHVSPDRSATCAIAQGADR